MNFNSKPASYSSNKLEPIEEQKQGLEQSQGQSMQSEHHENNNSVVARSSYKQMDPMNLEIVKNSSSMGKWDFR
jgi:hypothetical protein